MGQDKFNLQTYLRDMHQDLKADIKSTSDKVDSVDTKVSNHEVRIVVVENHRRAVRWLTALLVTTLVTALVARYFGL